MKKCEGIDTRVNGDIVGVANKTFLANYRPAPVVFTKGEGCRLTDVEGHSYLDLCAGIAVVSVGHGHPRLAEAIGQQAARLMHVSNLFYNGRAVQLAAELADRTPFSRFFFCNSGAEANEALLKLARRYHFEQGDAARTGLVAALDSFHGRSMGALSLTGQTKYHQGVGPMVPGVTHVPFDDLDALRAAVGPTTAGVLLEPIQGEGGIRVPSAGYLQGAREICDDAGALLMFDEVQTGIGRTGKFLACEHSGVTPDACSLAKGIAGGFPLGAMAVREELVDGLPPGSHATTYGGNALACAAGYAVLEILDDEGLVQNAARVGQHLAAGLADLVKKHGSATEVRGEGLLRGLVLDGVDPATVLTAVRERRVLLSLAGGTVLRFTPPLCVTTDQIDEGLEVVDSVLTELS